MRYMPYLQTIAVAALAVGLGCATESTDEAATSESSAGDSPPATSGETAAEDVFTARAALSRSDGTEVGEVTFRESGGVVEVHARVHGVEPGDHGLHVHETGDCSAGDFTSAGGHFNPTAAPHAGPDASEHHAGDFGNIHVGEDGSGELRLESEMLTVAESGKSVAGKAMILHAQADDLSSQPSGAAGARIACGVIERVDPGTDDTAALPEETAGDALQY